MYRRNLWSLKFTTNCWQIFLYLWTAGAEFRNPNDYVQDNLHSFQPGNLVQLTAPILWEKWMVPSHWGTSGGGRGAVAAGCLATWRPEKCPLHTTRPGRLGKWPAHITLTLQHRVTTSKPSNDWLTRAAAIGICQQCQRVKPTREGLLPCLGGTPPSNLSPSSSGK